MRSNERSGAVAGSHPSREARVRSKVPPSHHWIPVGSHHAVVSCRRVVVLMVEGALRVMGFEQDGRAAIEHLETAVVRFEVVARRVDLGSVDADGLDRVIAMLRRIRSEADGLVVRAGVRADVLAGDGVGAPARDALLGTGQVRGSTARREAARARLAARSPELGRVMGSGGLGPDHLEAMVRRLGRLADEHLGRVDLAPLVERGSALAADTFDAALRRAVEAAAPTDTEADDDHDRARARSEVRHWFDHRTGMGHLTGRLDPERYEALVGALDQHTSTLANRADGEVAKNANLTAEALVELVCSSGERQAHLPQVTVVVDWATLRRGRHDGTVAETGDGQRLSDAAVSRLCCDAVLRRVILDGDGVPIDVGRRYRTATDAQWAALRAVYSSCAWAGCDRPLSHCQAHHLRHWQAGGPTDLDNLVPLCSHHHHLVHEGRWHIELLADRAMAITRPDGRHHRTTCPPTRQPRPVPLA